MHFPFWLISGAPYGELQVLHHQCAYCGGRVNSRFLLLDLREWGCLFTKPLKPWGSQVTSTQPIRLLSSLTLNVEREDGKRKVRFTVQPFLLQDHSFLTISQPLGTSLILISFYTSFSILPSLWAPDSHAMLESVSDTSKEQIYLNRCGAPLFSEHEWVSKKQGKELMHARHCAKTFVPTVAFKSQNNPTR